MITNAEAREFRAEFIKQLTLLRRAVTVLAATEGARYYEQNEAYPERIEAMDRVLDLVAKS